MKEEMKEEVVKAAIRACWNLTLAIAVGAVWKFCDPAAGIAIATFAILMELS